MHVFAFNDDASCAPVSRDYSVQHRPECPVVHADVHIIALTLARCGVQFVLVGNIDEDNALPLILRYLVSPLQLTPG